MSSRTSGDNSAGVVNATQLNNSQLFPPGLWRHLANSVHQRTKLRVGGAQASESGPPVSAVTQVTAVH